MAVELVVSLGALVVALVNGAALVWSARQVREQRRAIAALTVIERRLESRVNRLAAAVDQTLQQLHRAIELASSIHRLSYDVLIQSAGHRDALGTIQAYLIELKAIAVVSGDTALIEAVVKLRTSVDSAWSDGQGPVDGAESHAAIAGAVEQVQRRIYQHIKDATHIPARMPSAHGKR